MQEGRDSVALHGGTVLGHFKGTHPLGRGVKGGGGGFFFGGYGGGGVAFIS